MNIKVNAKYKEDLQALDVKSASLGGILGQQSVKNRKPTSIYISLPRVGCKQGVFPEGWGGPGVHSAPMDRWIVSTAVTTKEFTTGSIPAVAD